MDWKTRFQNLLAHLAGEYDQFVAWIGTIGNLNTTATNLVDAINEVAAEAGGTVPDASTTQKGLAELSDDAETLAFTSDAVVVTPGTLGSVLNVNNGIPKLDATGKVAPAQLPSYVDDVVEVANFAALPAEGEAGKIYVTLDTNNQYRWSGSAYQEIVESPGSTDAVPEGVTNLYFTNTRADARADLRIETLVGDEFDMVAYYEAAKA